MDGTTRSHIGSVTAALFIAAVAAACSSATGGGARTSPQATTSQGDLTIPAPATAGNARYPYTAADVHFMSAMIGHHAQAVVASRLVPARSTSASVSTLAERIISTQQDEIVTMQQWLHDRGQPVPAAGATGMKMMMNGMEHEMRMPGMLTDAQMEQLEQAKGPEFDRLFLTFMIQHHRGAVAMVKELFGTHGAGQDETVFKFASDVHVDQSTEIARMQKMLAALILEGGQP